MLLPILVGAVAGVFLAALILFVMSEHFDQHLAEW